MEKNNQSLLMCSSFLHRGFCNTDRFGGENKTEREFYASFNQICSQND